MRKKHLFRIHRKSLQDTSRVEQSGIEQSSFSTLNTDAHACTL